MRVEVKVEIKYDDYPGLSTMNLDRAIEKALIPFGYKQTDGGYEFQTNKRDLLFRKTVEAIIDKGKLNTGKLAEALKELCDEEIENLVELCDCQDEEALAMTMKKYQESPTVKKHYVWGFPAETLAPLVLSEVNRRKKKRS